jgi:DNA/RNA endonuclease YhcR with UshA esterase domain
LPTGIFICTDELSSLTFLTGYNFKNIKVMISNKRFNTIIILAVLSVFLVSCKKEFENPSQWDRPVGEVYTIAQLRAMYDNGNSPVVFDAHASVYATVTMDERSGNIYRSVYIQDATAAIQLRLQAPGGLYLGDSIRVYLKGTTVNKYQGMYQIDNANGDFNVEKLAVQKFIEPKTITLTQLNSGQFQSQLIRLEDVQFNAGDLGKTYADKPNLASEDRSLENCDGQSVIVRTSGYANFADRLLPEGKGSIIAVAATYVNTIQLYLRSPQEVNLTEPRCPVAGDDFELITIASLRAQFAGGSTTIAPNTRIEGVVISDRAAANITSRNIVLMDESGAGITVRFSANHNFNLGDRVRILTSNLPMANFNNLLQIEPPIGNGVYLSPGTLPQPLTATIEQINSNLEAYESRLVTISNVTFSGGTNFGDSSGNLTINDGTGSMTHRTTSWASFASNPVPTSAVTLTGIVGVFGTTKQFSIRNLNDISNP